EAGGRGGGQAGRGAGRGSGRRPRRETRVCGQAADGSPGGCQRLVWPSEGRCSRRAVAVPWRGSLQARSPRRRAPGAELRRAWRRPGLLPAQWVPASGKEGKKEKREQRLRTNINQIFTAGQPWPEGGRTRLCVGCLPRPPAHLSEHRKLIVAERKTGVDEVPPPRPISGVQPGNRRTRTLNKLPGLFCEGKDESDYWIEAERYSKNGEESPECFEDGAERARFASLRQEGFPGVEHLPLEVSGAYGPGLLK
ncbi:PREDICTED: uncharacterized protein LOC106148413, partial [Chinchilla lanigera]|uniref:uncharacterized protein LOC106148413 n=1 Tax=Chinchilla lanigera TaxID=34839 RepID=UPI00069914B1